MIRNERAGFDYELGEKFEAGLLLRGFEVKALRLGRGTLAGGRVIERGGEAFLVGAKIQPYQPANPPQNFEPERIIKLLLTKEELRRLTGLGRRRGLTLIPVAIYNKNGRLKLEFALARGKKKYDKRTAIKAREANRQIERTLKTRRG